MECVYVNFIQHIDKISLKNDNINPNFIIFIEHLIKINITFLIKLFN